MPSLEEKIVAAALRCGAGKAAVIPGESIVLSAAFRELCAQNRCGVYGKCWMCPPDNGGIEDCMNKVRSYPKAVLYQRVHPLEDSFDIEGMAEGKKELVRLSQRIEDEVRALLPKGAYLHLSGGGCGLCERCARQDNAPCRFPDRALSSMEGYGIDVYQTTAGTELKYINGPNTVTYFGLVLFHDPN